MPNKLDQLIMDVQHGQLAMRALTEPIEEGLVPLYIKGLDAYTRFLQTMQTLDQAIIVAVRQETVFKVPR